MRGTSPRPCTARSPRSLSCPSRSIRWSLPAASTGHSTDTLQTPDTHLRCGVGKRHPSNRRCQQPDMPLWRHTKHPRLPAYYKNPSVRCCSSHRRGHSHTPRAYWGRRGPPCRVCNLPSKLGQRGPPTCACCVLPRNDSATVPSSRVGAVTARDGIVGDARLGHRAYIGRL